MARILIIEDNEQNLYLDTFFAEVLSFLQDNMKGGKGGSDECNTNC